MKISIGLEDGLRDAYGWYWEHAALGLSAGEAILRNEAIFPRR